MSMSLQVSVQRRAEPARTTFSAASLADSAATSSLPTSRTSLSRRRSSSPSSAIRSSPASTFSSNFAPRPRRSRSVARLGRRPQLLGRGDAGLVVDPPHRLRADAGDPRHLDERRRELLLQLDRRGDLALLEEGDDLLLDRVADSLQLGRPALPAPARRPARGCRRSPGRPPCRRGPGSGWRRRARRACRARGTRRRSRRCACRESRSSRGTAAAEPPGGLRVACLSRVRPSDARRRALNPAHPGRPADLQRGRQPRVARRRRARRGAGGDRDPRRRRRLAGRHRRDRRPPRRRRRADRGPAPGRQGGPRPRLRRRLRRAPSPPAPSWSSRWTPTSPTIPPTSRG